MEHMTTDLEKAAVYYNQAEEFYAKKEYEKMIPLYKKAAELGHLQSMHCLGYSYRHGQGVEQNYKRPTNGIKRRQIRAT